MHIFLLPNFRRPTVPQNIVNVRAAESGCDRRHDGSRQLSMCLHNASSQTDKTATQEVQSKGSGSVPVTRGWSTSWSCASAHTLPSEIKTSLLLGNVLAWTKCVNIKVFPCPCSRLRFYVSVTLLPSKPTEDKTCKLWRALRLFVDRPGFILLKGIYWQ